MKSSPFLNITLDVVTFIECDRDEKCIQIQKGPFYRTDP